MMVLLFIIALFCAFPGIPFLIIAIVTNYWYFFLFLCVLVFVVYFLALKTSEKEKLSHNDKANLNGQNRSDMVEVPTIQSEVVDDADICLSESADTVDEQSSVYEIDAYRVAPNASLKSQPNDSDLLEAIKEVPVYCKAQQDYGNGHIISLNPTSHTLTIRYQDGPHSYSIDYIGITIFAVAGDTQTTELKDLVAEYFELVGNLPPKIPAQNTHAKTETAEDKLHSPDIEGIYNPSWEAKPYYNPEKPPAKFYHTGKAPCFSDEWISRRVSVERTKTRGKILYETGSVLKFNKMGRSYQAVVRGSKGTLYNCNFTLDDNNHIKKWSCNCPAFFKYRKACKHLVAVFYAARHYVDNDTDE